MLQLKNIVKDYEVGDTKVRALRGVSVEFRQQELVSILGPSGCGKTTLMNILSGLDKATEGDLFLRGVSTKEFKEHDWDDYRNQKIGLVFQSYNLIQHLSVLTNVELSLTISGVTGVERSTRAKEALDKVGLSDQYHKRPNQLSGGQMQRVAIARAIVNSPDILIADEPTGAIDSETSLQIMEILKKIAEEKLVVVVTHNRELAENYSTRIIQMLDGQMLSDSNPYNVAIGEDAPAVPDAAAETDASKKKRRKGVTMSFWTAVKLSLQNLINKRGRSVLTAVAGSIGIISIALILAVNSGFSSYIADYERQSMARYPITVTTGESSILSVLEDMLGDGALSGDKLDIDSILSVFTDPDSLREKYTDEEIIFVYEQLLGMFTGGGRITKEADISVFKKHIEDNFNDNWATVRYDFNINMNVYLAENNGYTQINPLYELLHSVLTMMISGAVDSDTLSSMKSIVNSFIVWDELIADTDTIEAQYDVLKGNLPKNRDEIVFVVDEYNQASDLMMFAIGEIPLLGFIGAMTGDEGLSMYDVPFEEMIGREFYVLPNGAAYVYNESTKLYDNVNAKKASLAEAIEGQGIKLTVSGILRPKPGVDGGCINGVLGYTSELAEFIMSEANESNVIKAQTAEYEKYLAKLAAAEPIQKRLQEEEVKLEDLTIQEQMILATAYTAKIKNVVTGESMSETEYKTFLRDSNVRDPEKPSSIYFYPTSKAYKNDIVNFIKDFNERMEAETPTESEKYFTVEFTDELDTIIAEISSLVNIIVYVLLAVALVAVIVTMLLVAIIMYIAVQDRTREIGILRSLGARRLDIANIFNVETMLLGLASGIIGVIISLILVFPANLICKSALGISNLLQPVWWQYLLLIFAAMVITVVSGLIPSSMAAKKDPVIALRTE